MAHYRTYDGTAVSEATSRHTGTLIFLHGLGDTGDSWAGQLAEIKEKHVKLICPTAHTMPVTINNGMQMPSWFDIKSMNPNGPQDKKGIRRASKMVHSMIYQEIEQTGIPSSRIVLGGFSQGGALTYYSALTFWKPLAGVIALSSWLPLHKKFHRYAGKVNKATPFLICHGDADPFVHYDLGRLSVKILATVVKNYEFKVYSGLMHSVCNVEMRDVKNFLRFVLPASRYH